MPRVELSSNAVVDLERLRVTHRLPPDTGDRIREAVRSLGRFPQLGPALESPEWAGFRYLLGPWRWLVLLYEHLQDENRVVIVTIQDGRSAASSRI